MAAEWYQLSSPDIHNSSAACLLFGKQRKIGGDDNEGAETRTDGDNTAIWLWRAITVLSARPAQSAIIELVNEKNAAERTEKKRSEMKQFSCQVYFPHIK